jgi:hypothetical protein
MSTTSPPPPLQKNYTSWGQPRSQKSRESSVDKSLEGIAVEWDDYFLNIESVETCEEHVLSDFSVSNMCFSGASNQFSNGVI